MRFYHQRVLDGDPCHLDEHVGAQHRRQPVEQRLLPVGRVLYVHTTACVTGML
jgi:hypothetical protein